MRRGHEINVDFHCVHCGAYVSSATFLAGVNNRNHCPYCLWSRHMDLYEAGDRLSACKAPMRPIGLTLKRSRNKYAGRMQGELMLVHRCGECQALSINRIAADDVPEFIMEVYQASLGAPERLRRQIDGGGIHLLGSQHAELVYRQLFGSRAPQHSKEMAVLSIGA